MNDQVKYNSYGWGVLFGLGGIILAELISVLCFLAITELLPNAGGNSGYGGPIIFMLQPGLAQLVVQPFLMRWLYRHGRKRSMLSAIIVASIVFLLNGLCTLQML